jgi:hypothetical protein
MMALVASFPLVALGIEPVTLAYVMDGAAGW